MHRGLPASPRRASRRASFEARATAGQLTVLENITFSALTRLPANWTAEQKREKIMDVLYVLNLTKTSLGLPRTPLPGRLGDEDLATHLSDLPKYTAK